MFKSPKELIINASEKHGAIACHCIEVDTGISTVYASKLTDHHAITIVDTDQAIRTHVTQIYPENRLSQVSILNDLGTGRTHTQLNV